MKRILIFACVTSVLVAALLPLPAALAPDAVAERARRLHFSSLVLDTHVDVTMNMMRAGWSFGDEHTTGHVDLPRMKRGGLNAMFFSIWISGETTGPRAVHEALERIAEVRALAEQYPNDVSLCTTSDQVRRARRAGKIAALMGMEGGHMINNSLPVLRNYAALGVRYLTLTHSVHTDWADSSGEAPKHGGLTEFGRNVVGELNRLGMLVDISHVSDQTFREALAVSRAPMIASHSSCRTISPHPRNLTDEMIKALAARGGVIQINFHEEFIDPAVHAYWQKADPLRRELRAKYPGRENLQRVRDEVQQRLGPAPRAQWERILDHIDHAVRLVGPNHVGLGSDFDGARMPDGMDDCTKLPRLTEALLRRGYSESEVKKILGENTLRLLGEVERVAAQLKPGRPDA